ncbi:adaptor-related protein complex 3, delta 1 subunit-like garnet [Brevipalpus obovatus]|uniref:adaptor-related protein complex 3, delta 1 subunit-like garnet n=1 Tax=Brevipalpus obovatus TaxID=246614 RepID=UPI003D9E72B7
MTFRKVVGNLERFFDKNLTDLVRGIRNNKENEAKYIAQCIEEIKEELKQDNVAVKANAVAKLTYLQMLGYDMTWAAFNIVEVMSSTKFTYKRIGYLSASQCFHENTEIVMLTTNMIRKDLNSQNMYDAGCAMSSLACFISTDISRDLANDVMTLLSSTKPYLRKKAVLLMYKIFLKYPEALKPAFPRLREKLEDPDPGVQSAAVNVICELARKNPKNYLSLAPIFFKLMTNSTNNWMLIKIIKLFGALIPIEPRLGKKLIDPLTNIIHSTSAMSLLYECVNTVIAVLISISSGLPYHSSSIQLCVQKLRILIEDSDQNLKYLGLLAMSKILKTHPKSVQAHKDLVLACLDDKDESIRLRALDLLYGMVSKKNLMEIVKKLLVNVSESQLGNKYRDELISKVIDICSQNDYQYIVNFEWYLTVLVELTRVEGGTDHGTLIAQQILDVAIRVESIREFVTKQMAILIENNHMFVNTSVCEVLYAASWICGEFAEFLPDKKQIVLNLLTKQAFPPHIESIFIHNACKIYAKILTEDSRESICNFSQEVLGRLEPFLISEDLEVQERATNMLQIVNMVLESDENIDWVSVFYPYNLNPVASIAQRKVPVPQGLNLNEPFRDDTEDVEEITDRIPGFTLKEDSEEEYKEEIRGQTYDDEEAREDARIRRAFDYENNPHYLKPKKNSTREIKQDDEIESAEEIAEVDPISRRLNRNSIPGLASSDTYVKKNKEKKKKKSKRSKRPQENCESPELEIEHVVTIKGLEMPEGADLNDTAADENDLSDSDPHKALAQFKLDEPPRSNPPSKSVNKLADGLLKEKKKVKKSKVSKEHVKPIEEEDKPSSGKKVKKSSKEKKRVKIVEPIENEVTNTAINKEDKKVKKKKIKPPNSLDLSEESIRKKEKKVKRSIKKSLEGDDLDRKRADYEETVEGLTTPSQRAPELSPITPSVTEKSSEICESLLPKVTQSIKAANTTSFEVASDSMDLPDEAK